MGTMEKRMAEPAYFSVIAGTVLDDRVLSDSAKLLYGRITSLADREGYCWASNRRLSELSGYGERTVSRLIAQLESRGHIWTETTAARKVGGRERRIYVGNLRLADIDKNGETICINGIDKNGETICINGIDKNGEGSQFCLGGIDKNGETYIRKNNKYEESPLYPPSEDKTALELFERFWAVYPRKQNKAAARKAWDKLKPDMALCFQMADALRAQMLSPGWNEDGGKYIPYPSTWLNGRRWEDEMLPPRPTAGDCQSDTDGRRGRFL